MKANLSYIALSFISIVSLVSCKNDLDVLAPGEESVSVYGVLNPNEPVQKIRINKVYLTDGDALEVAQDPNQINYGPGELHVTLQRFVGGSTTPTLTTVGNTTRKEIVLTETVVTTAGGNFSQEQRIWQTSDKLYNNGEYKLVIKNVNSGKEFTAHTLMIDSVKPYSSMPFNYTTNSPSPNHYPVHCGTGNGAYVGPTGPSSPTQDIAFVDYSILTARYKIKFKSIPNAKLYKVIMRFHYIDSLFDGTGYRRHVDYNFSSQLSSTLVGGQELEVSFEAPEFYNNLASEIPKQSVGSIKLRRAHYMEYIIYACSENMNTFLMVNQPSNTIAQDKPNYTNINGGVGIFASISKSDLGKELRDDFINKIVDNPTTNSLQFVKRYTFICP